MKQLLILTWSLCLSTTLFSGCSSGHDTDSDTNTPVAAPSISFPDNSDGIFYAKAGFSLTITPQIENGSGAQYTWLLDGEQVGTSASYTFLSSDVGTYTLTLTVKTTGGETTRQLSIIVNPVDANYRPATSSSLANCNAVYEYTPAPGQYINDISLGGFSRESTMEEACAYALNRLENDAFISLGAFGGRVIVGFDHSVYNEQGYDFSVTGNSFEGNSEPGIVYVMQDENGNGEPDDTWYELKGSEYGNSETLQDYSITYYKPQEAGSDTRWEDSEGNEGVIYYIPDFHDQDYYYPTWITGDSYTLSGTRLAPRVTSGTGTGYVLNAYDWGYADNFSTVDGSGSNADGSGARVNNFDIDNAVTTDGSPAGLHHIDFVRIQTGVLFSTETVGELSTEVLGVKDLNAGN